MKRLVVTLIVLAVFAASLLLAGCSTSSTASDIPAPNATPSASDTPLHLAEEFLQAVEAKDLGAASQYYAPGKQPTSWKQVMGIYEDTAPNQVPDVSGCQGVSHTSTERQVLTQVAVTFTFAATCVQALPPFSAYDSNLRQDQNFGVILEYANNRWYVQGVDDRVASQ